MNRRGEVLTILIVAGACLIIGGLLPNPIKWFQTASVPNTDTHTYDTKDVTITPFVAINEANGTTTVANKIEEHSAKGKDTHTPKRTWAQWFFGLLAGMGWWGIVIVALCILFPVGAAAKFAQLRGVWKSAFKNQYTGLKELKDTTVICRKCGDAVTIDTKEHVFDGVDKALDKRDKVLQEVVRTELVKK